MKKVLKNKWVLLIAIVIILIVIISIFLIFGLKKTKFEIEDFTITEEKTDYEYTDNYITYTGDGTITTKDKKGVYLVFIKIKLVSGGNKEKDNREYVSICIVSDGEGEFSTYDSCKEQDAKTPKYKCEIIGYQKMKPYKK